MSHYANFFKFEAANAIEITKIIEGYQLELDAERELPEREEVTRRLLDIINTPKAGADVDVVDREISDLRAEKAFIVGSTLMYAIDGKAEKEAYLDGDLDIMVVGHPASSSRPLKTFVDIAESFGAEEIQFSTSLIVPVTKEQYAEIESACHLESRGYIHPTHPLIGTKYDGSTITDKLPLTAVKNFLEEEIQDWTLNMFDVIKTMETPRPGLIVARPFLYPGPGDCDTDELVEEKRLMELLENVGFVFEKETTCYLYPIDHERNVLQETPAIREMQQWLADGNTVAIRNLGRAILSFPDRRDVQLFTSPGCQQDDEGGRFIAQEFVSEFHIPAARVILDLSEGIRDGIIGMTAKAIAAYKTGFMFDIRYITVNSGGLDAVLSKYKRRGWKLAPIIHKDPKWSCNLRGYPWHSNRLIMNY